MLLAKGIVFAVIATVVGIITSFGGVLSPPSRSGHTSGLAAHIGDPGVLRAIIGGGLYVLASGMFGFAFGAMIRHTAGAITAAVASALRRRRR